MRWFKSFLIAMGLAVLALAHPRVWTTHLEFETCGCTLKYAEVFLPGDDNPILAGHSRFSAQWVFESEGDSASTMSVIRQMSKRGFYQYTVYLTSTENAQTLIIRNFWLTPFGVALTDPGRPPETDDTDAWNAWLKKHSYGHADFGKEFAKLWWKGSGEITFLLYLRTQYCLEKGEPSE